VKYHDTINRIQGENEQNPKSDWAMLSLHNFGNRRPEVEETLENKAKSRDQASGEGLLTPNMG
jgi:hypothetical protein